jgi:hypothetical protein
MTVNGENLVVERNYHLVTRGHTGTRIEGCRMGELAMFVLHARSCLLSEGKSEGRYSRAASQSAWEAFERADGAE